MPVRNNLLVSTAVRPSQIPHSGRGLYACENILKNTFIGFYEAEWYRYGTTDFNKCRGGYSFYVNDYMTLEIMCDDESMPYSALLNDAHGSGFDNNVEPHVMIPEAEVAKIRGRNCGKYDPSRIIGLYTMRDICVGEELFLDYGNTYWWVAK